MLLKWICLLILFDNILCYHKINNNYNKKNNNLNPLEYYHKHIDSYEPFNAFIESSSHIMNAPTTNSSKKVNTIKGKISLNNQMYETRCACQKLMKNCNPQAVRFRVHQESTNAEKGLTRQELKNLLRSPKLVKMVNVLRTHLSCVDGRDGGNAVVATPGGMLGEWFNAAAVMQDIINRQPTEAEVRELMQKYLAQADGVGLSFCTDERAIQHLEQNLRVNGERGKVIGLNILEPPGNLRPQILESLKNPMNHGDYFTKAVLTHPEAFNMDRKTVENVISAYFNCLWDKQTTVGGKVLASSMRLDIYEGEPRAKAWINFQTTESCAKDHMAPLFAPQDVIYANTPQAASIFRKQLGNFLMTYFPLKIDRKQFVARLNRGGMRNMESYAEIVGSNGPYYSVLVE